MASQPNQPTQPTQHTQHNRPTIPPNYVCADSFISPAANLYDDFNSNIAKEHDSDNADTSDIKCQLSLITPKDTDKGFDWINVRFTDLVCKPYNCKELRNYLNYDPSGKDPNRILRNLNHLRTRLDSIANVPDSVKILDAKTITDEFLCNLLKKMITGWRLEDSLTLAMSYGTLFGINIWQKVGLIHDISYDEAETILEKSKKGAFMLRRSSKSKENPFHTVFSLSYKCISSLPDNETRDVYHIRFMSVHGVGVYCLTSVLNNSKQIIATDKDLAETNYPKLLDLLGYQPPPFACITSLLIYLFRHQYINLDRIWSIDDVALSLV